MRERSVPARVHTRGQPIIEPNRFQIVRKIDIETRLTYNKNSMYDPHQLPDNVLTTQLKRVVNWSRR
ncbi:MAG TPA: hypothetical protein VF595_08730, partial [Tepidisphaeraceae bacterium]